jgi:hypothetical protein
LTDTAQIRRSVMLRRIFLYLQQDRLGASRDRSESLAYLSDLLLDGAVLLGVVEVEVQLFGVTAGEKCGDADRAAVALGELRPLPHLVEQHRVGVVGEPGCEVPARRARGASSPGERRGMDDSARSRAGRYVPASRVSSPKSARLMQVSCQPWRAAM